MVRLNSTLCDDNITKEELLKNIEIKKTSYDDTQTIITILKKSFNINSEKEVLLQLLNSLADLDNSVKVIDKRNGNIYGLLIFSRYNLKLGTPIMFFNPILGDKLSKLPHINGHSFVIDKRLRNCGIDKQMLMFNIDYLKQYDFVWCGVEASLKSHNYWRRLGFQKVIDIDEAKFYVKFLN